MIAMKGRVGPVLPVVSAGLLLISLWPVLSTAEWGKPLGGTYGGPEGKPRVVTPSPAELGVDERATMAVFERATKSVVFIANTAIQRDPWSFNLFEVPQGSGTGFVWNKQGHIVTNFHVVYGANSVTVTLADRTEHKATLIGADPLTMWRCCRFVRQKRRFRLSPSGRRMTFTSDRKYWRSGIRSAWIIR